MRGAAGVCGRDPARRLQRLVELHYRGGRCGAEGGGSGTHLPDERRAGSFDATGETGSVSFSFHECQDPFNTTCQTPGDPSGTVTTTTLPFHLKTKPGTQAPLIQITTNNGHFATFECAFGLVSIEIVGNGIIGEITSPGYGAASSTFGMSFAESGGAQAVRKTEEDGATEYDLKAKVNGGPEETFTLVTSQTGTIAAGGTTTLTKT